MIIWYEHAHIFYQLILQLLHKYEIRQPIYNRSLPKLI
jgi:predicted metal-dependent RNase